MVSLQFPRVALLLGLSLALVGCTGDDSSSSEATSDGSASSTTEGTATTTTAASETSTATATTTMGTTDPTTTTMGTTDATATTGGVCGDGSVDVGEECDDGADNNGPGKACKADCTANVCGDGDVGPGEACDDGNMVDDDACSNTCAQPGCGDGMVQNGEECDDGNASNEDACLTSCLNATCGDTFVQAGVEECDDGNQVNDDACTNQCTAASCNDKIQNGDETDVDCGGGCDGCDIGGVCVVNEDCKEMLCTAGACDDPNLVLPDCQSANVTAAMLHMQVISMKCGVGCHLGMSMSGGLNMGSSANLIANTVNVPALESPLNRITPGKPEESYLVYKILGQQTKAMGSGSQMPLGGSLTDAEKCLIINWVKSGAN